jgi:protocatechuate 3,4-dioxygenase beta subunit
VDEASRAVPIALELNYPDAIDQLPRQVAGLIFDPGESMEDIQAQPSVRVTVEVTRGVTHVPAVVQLSKAGQIPGTRLQVSRQTGSGGASLEALPDVYDVEVRPDVSTGLPPRRIALAITAADQGRVVSLPLVGDGEQMVEVRGKLLLQFEGAAKAEPARHVRITARSDDGARSNTLLLCAPGEVGCDGSFSGLMLPAQRLGEARRYTLLVEATEDAPAVPTLVLPLLEVNAALLAQGVTSGDTLQVTLPQPLQALNVPALTTRRVQLINADTGAPVVGATARVQTQPQGLEQATTSYALSDAEGFATLRVAPQQPFSLVITPSEASDRAVLTATIDPAVSGEDALLTLPMFERISVSGRVLGRGPGEQVADAEVEAIPVEALGAMQVQSSARRRVSTFTDAQGRFTLRLDAGPYRLQTVPPLSSGLPRRDLTLDVAQAKSLDVTLGRSSLVFGRVLDPQGVPSPGVQVKVYHHASWSAATLIGEGLTDAQGVYRVIVPNADDLTDAAAPL